MEQRGAGGESSAAGRAVAVGAFAVAAFVWVQIGMGVLSGDDVSARGAAVCIACTVLGWVLATPLGARRSAVWRRRAGGGATTTEPAPSMYVGLGVMLIGTGALWAVGGEPSGPEWVVLAGASTVGGLNLGVPAALARGSHGSHGRPGVEAP